MPRKRERIGLFTNGCVAIIDSFLRGKGAALVYLVQLPPGLEAIQIDCGIDLQRCPTPRANSAQTITKPPSLTECIASTGYWTVVARYVANATKWRTPSLCN
jgi:hypothetical protein